MSSATILTFAGAAPKVGTSSSALVTAVAAPRYAPGVVSSVIDVRGDVCDILGVDPTSRRERRGRLDMAARLGDVLGELHRVEVATGVDGVDGVEVLPGRCLAELGDPGGEVIAHVALLLAGSGRTVTIDAGCVDTRLAAQLGHTAIVIVSGGSRDDLDKARTVAGEHEAACSIALGDPRSGTLSRADLTGDRVRVVPFARTEPRRRWYAERCRTAEGDHLFGMLVDASEVHAVAERHLQRQPSQRHRPARSGRGMGL